MIRRRLRKRKKRPPVILDDSTGDDIIFTRPLRRRVRPQNLHENQTPWDEIRDDDIVRPFIRRRIPPRLPIFDENTEEEFSNNERPIQTMQPENAEVEVSTKEKEINATENQDSHDHIVNLKTILKQTTGTLSLSEILQQKNLSLTELLSGNEKAFSSLTEKPLVTTENIPHKKTNGDEENGGLKKTSDRYLEEEIMKDVKLKKTDANFKRLAPKKPTNNDESTKDQLQDHSLYDTTTERRIFVPSHPKYYTSLNFKPDLRPFFNENLEKPESSTKTPPKVANNEPNKPCSNTSKLPTTNAKLKQNIKESDKQNYVITEDILKPTKINLSELNGFEDMRKLKTETKNRLERDKPIRVTIDLTAALSGIDSEKSTTETYENTVYVTAREEIMEVLRDPASKEKLSRILELRNMTLDELVQQRERGSSQVHLADIFHNKSMEPEPKEEILVGHIEPEHFISPNERQQKSRQFELEQPLQKQILEHIITANKIEDLLTNNMQAKPDSNITMEKFEVQTEASMQTVVWKASNEEVDATHNNTKIDISNPTDLFTDMQNLDNLEDLYAVSSNENFEVKHFVDDDDVFFKLPSGVKSAIFVSLAIIGLSIVVFLTILMIFKWSQLKNRKINYCNSLTSKFRSPMILQGRPTAAIKTFVNETLGRRKTYYKNNVQRMCEDIWEGDKERKLSF